MKFSLFKNKCLIESRGISLVELIVALAITSIVVFIGSNFVNRILEYTKGQEQRLNAHMHTLIITDQLKKDLAVAEHALDNYSNSNFNSSNYLALQSNYLDITMNEKQQYSYWMSECSNDIETSNNVVLSVDDWGVLTKTLKEKGCHQPVRCSEGKQNPVIKRKLNEGWVVGTGTNLSTKCFPTSYRIDNNTNQCTVSANNITKGNDPIGATLCAWSPPNYGPYAATISIALIYKIKDQLKIEMQALDWSRNVIPGQKLFEYRGN